MVMVENGAELLAALSSAEAGEVIELAAGDYGDVTINQYSFTDYVTIKSQDPQQMAVFDTLSVKNSSYLRFEGIDVHHELDEYEPDWVSRIDKSDHIQVVNSMICGSADGDFLNDGVWAF